MMLAELPHCELGAVLYDAAKLDQPTRKSAAVDRNWVMAGNAICERILLLPTIRCVAIVWREAPCELVPLERCWRMDERRKP